MRFLLGVAAVVGCSGSDRSVNAEWVDVPGGMTYLGCERWPASYALSQYDLCVADEYPIEKYVIAFQALRGLVTHDGYADCVKAEKCTKPAREWSPSPKLPDASLLDTLPIAVSYADAQQYCAWLDGSLPKLDQWERLARGDRHVLYPWGDASPSCANGPAFQREQFAPLVSCPLATQEHFAASGPFGTLAMSGWGGEWTVGPKPPDKSFLRETLQALVTREGDVATFDRSKLQLYSASGSKAPNAAIVKGGWGMTIGEYERIDFNELRVFRCTQPVKQRTP